MWALLRPDAISILKDKEAKASLPRYFAILSGEKISRFLIAKKVRVDIDLSSDLSELWKAHDEALNFYWELEKAVDTKKIRYKSIPDPRVSLLDLKSEIANRLLKSCIFCERRCGVN